ncbi:nucleotidyltransferase [Flavobacterium sp. C4GT6]|uniref:nucleotidyltransferase n=1 Tax=Flavobacterium sp. C4GT6 TaxID=3103818 RepID=UPI002ECFEAEE
MVNIIQKREYLEGVLRKMVEILDITPTQHKEAVEKYQAVTNYLKEDDNIARYGLEMYPQGSFSLGTVTKPDSDIDELDIDLVCELTSANHNDFSQYQLKQLIGNRLKSGRYKDMLASPDGRRCWRIDYAESTRFHLDILPSIPDKSRTNVTFLHVKDYSKSAISITDKQDDNYYRINENWHKSNPKGYLEWFKKQMIVQLNESKKLFSARNNVKIDEVPDYEVKTPLQRAIQIMKRHRNTMFCNTPGLNYDDKPISIIITTLAAKAYSNEANLYDALMNILAKMPDYINYKYINGRKVTWIENPVDSRENFADKWETYPVREKNFYLWIEEAKEYFRALLQKEGQHVLNESLQKGFGDKLIKKTFSAIGEDTRIQRERGALGVTMTGIINESAPKKVHNHTFYGKKE